MSNEDRTYRTMCFEILDDKKEATKESCSRQLVNLLSWKKKYRYIHTYMHYQQKRVKLEGDLNFQAQKKPLECIGSNRFIFLFLIIISCILLYIIIVNFH
jgi:hypothetical protein